MIMMTMLTPCNALRCAALGLRRGKYSSEQSRHYFSRPSPDLRTSEACSPAPTQRDNKRDYLSGTATLKKNIHNQPIIAESSGLENCWDSD